MSANSRGMSYRAAAVSTGEYLRMLARTSTIRRAACPSQKSGAAAGAFAHLVEQFRYLDDPLRRRPKQRVRADGAGDGTLGSRTLSETSCVSSLDIWSS